MRDQRWQHNFLITKYQKQFLFSSDYKQNTDFERLRLIN